VIVIIKLLDNVHIMLMCCRSTS